LVAGHGALSRRFADLSGQKGDTSQAVAILKPSVDAGDQMARRRTIRLLAENGDVDALQAEADTGDRYAARQLAQLLAARADVDRLRLEVFAGNSDDAARELMQLYRSHDSSVEAILRRDGLSADAMVPIRP
jgi:hypothetical protein